MSAIFKLKNQLRDAYPRVAGTRIPNSTARISHYNKCKTDPNYLPEQKKRPKRKRKRKNGTIQTVIEEVFPEKEKRKKRKDTAGQRKKKALTGEEEDSDSDDYEEPEPWDPEEIMDHLQDAAVVGDIANVISSIKGDNEGDKEIVWDHGMTKKGKISDQNLFGWLEAYSAHECLRKRTQDDAIFEDGASSAPATAPPPAKRTRKR